jgi:hypothetical protein
MKKLSKVSYIYVGGSVFLGPAIPVASELLFPKKLACFDAEPGIQYYAENLHQYQKAFVFQTICASIMIVVGLVLLARLARTFRKDKNKSYLAHISMIIFMLLGYGLIVALATFLLSCAS